MFKSPRRRRYLILNLLYSQAEDTKPRPKRSPGLKSTNPVATPVYLLITIILYQHIKPTKKKNKKNHALKTKFQTLKIRTNIVFLRFIASYDEFFCAVYLVKKSNKHQERRKIKYMKQLPISTSYIYKI